MKNIGRLTNHKMKEIIGGGSSNPGTQNWINGMGSGSKPQAGGSSAIGEGFNNKVGQCIAFGLAGRRGPFGCDS